MTRPPLIHCPSCGEDYAPSYRRCPFCNAKTPKRAEEYDEEPLDYEEGYDEPPRRGGGKRLAGARRSQGAPPWKWIAYLLSAVVIVAAVVIFITKLWPKLSSTAEKPSATPTPPTESVTPSVAPSVAPSEVPSEAPSELPGVIPEAPSELPSETPDPFLELPDPTDVPSTQPSPAATPSPVAGPRLNHTDFTISPKYPDPVKLTVSGGTAAAWRSSNEAVATVSQTGLVTAVGNGSATVTCTLDSGAALTCAVHVNGLTAESPSQPPATEPPASVPPASEAPAPAAKLNHTDFTINSTYPDPVQLRVTGGTASAWASKDESVATVSQTGLVTAVGGAKGSTQVTCTLDNGTVLTCDVRVDLQ